MPPVLRVATGFPLLMEPARAARADFQLHKVEPMARLTRLPNRIAALPARVASLPKVADQFYLSAEWAALKRQRARDPDYREAKARLKPGEWLVLDHITERRDGGADLDPKNTQWLTHSEHQAKTAKARKARAHGR